MKKLLAILLSTVMVVSMLAVIAPASAAATNVALGATYTISGTNAPQGTNWTANITDGVASEALDDSRWTNTWFAFGSNHKDGTDADGNTIGYVVIDLGSVQNISEVKIHFGNSGDAGVSGGAHRIFVSEDGQTWNAYGDVFSSASVTAGTTAWLGQVADASARYVKYQAAIWGAWSPFFNEIEVMADVAAEDSSADSSVEDSSADSSVEDSSVEDSSVEDSSVEDSSVEDSSVEDSSVEDSSVEDSSVEDSSSDDSSDVEVSIDDLMGEANADAKFDLVIEAPETFEAGVAFDVIISVNTEVALTDVAGILNFNPDELTLNTVFRKKALPCFNAYEEWEDLTIGEFDGETLIPGIINLRAATTGGEYGDTYTAVSENGVLTFKLNFTANEGVEEALLWIAHASVAGKCFDIDTTVDTLYVGNGSYAVVALAVEEEDSSVEDSSVEDSSVEDSWVEDSSVEDSSEVSSEASSEASSEVSSQAPVSSETEKPATGDASSMIVFAILALVAVAGSAVVIKSRK